jgi:hypothetical protein
MEEHIYQRLESNNHIRILILHPSQNRFAPLRCSIKHQEIGSAAEQYECISYTWGDQIRAHILCCDDGTVFEITVNLHSALSRFRSTSHRRYLWADAVCINQADSEEKSRQIPLMPRIYHYASRVLVWLGSGKDGESETMQSLGRLRKSPDSFSFASRYGEGTDQRVETQTQVADESIIRFFQLPWFSRLWVVQEAALNPDIMFYCGPSETSWPRLHFAVKSLPDSIWNDIPNREVRKSLQKLGDLWRTRSYLDHTMMKCELFDLLDSFHHLGCKEDKDRVYALAGLASDVQTSTELIPPTAYQKKIQLVPDYSLSDGEVFCQVALQRILSGRAFTTLAYAGAFRSRNGSRALSSWAPDFRLSKLWPTMLQEPILQPSVDLQSDGCLMLKGNVPIPYKWDLHSYGNQWNSFAVHTIFPGPTESEPRSMLQFVRDCVYWMHSLPTLVNLEKDVQNTALCDILHTVAKLGNEEYEMNVSMMRSLQSLLSSPFDDEDIEYEYLVQMEPCFSMIFKGLRGRCFFISNKPTMSRRWGDVDLGGWNHLGISLFGIGPGDIVAGDVVVGFAGVEEALFFRPIDGKHQVLGDGYFNVLPPGLENEFVSCRAHILLV